MIVYLRYLGGNSYLDSDGYVEGYAYAVTPLDDGFRIACGRGTIDVKVGPQFEIVDEAAYNASVNLAMAAAADVSEKHQVLEAEIRNAGDLAISDSLKPQPVSSAVAAQNSVGTALNWAHGFKRRLAELTESLKVRQGAIQAVIQSRLAAIQAQAESMNRQVERLNEVVESINLYLGREEEITLIRDGQLAPAGTAITIRQRVLFMDEETALDTDAFDLDFRKLDVFDNWVLDPAHLEQVLPESKGLVVMQVRRRDKCYFGDDTLAAAAANACMNEQNARSYWLVRNGDRLHRIWADIPVGHRLLPADGEVQEFFQRNLRPGSYEYRKAMEAADKRRRHYMKLALVLQGLIDRTRLFEPYVDGVKPSLMSPESWPGRIHFLYDDSQTLDDGHQSYSDWLKEVNSRLVAGSRVIGTWPCYTHRGEQSRVYPKNATGVKSTVAYTAEEHDVRGFKFYFERDNHPSLARYSFSASDSFFLCIDGAEVADMQYFLRNRQALKDYAAMVPLLQSAIEFKKHETVVERPFRELLERKLNEQNPDRPCTPEKLEALIRWYKTKVKNNRALTLDSTKAYRLITGEYKRQAGTAEATSLVASFERDPAVSAVFRRGNTLIVVYAIEDDPVYVHQKIWTYVSGEWKVEKVDEWLIPRKGTYAACDVVFTTTGWDKRPEGFVASKYLAEPERIWLADYARANLAQFRQYPLLAVYAQHDERGTEMRAVYAHVASVSDHATGTGMPKLVEHLVKFNRGKTEAMTEIAWSSRTYFGSPYRENVIVIGYGLSDDDVLNKGWERRGAKVYFLDEELLSRIMTAFEAAKERHRSTARSHSWANEQGQAAAAAMEVDWRAAEFKRYQATGGDLEFFNDYLKTLKQPDFAGVACAVSDAILDLLNGGCDRKDFSGKTLAQMVPKLQLGDEFHSGQFNLAQWRFASTE